MFKNFQKTFNKKVCMSIAQLVLLGLVVYFLYKYSRRNEYMTEEDNEEEKVEQEVTTENYQDQVEQMQSMNMNSKLNPEELLPKESCNVWSESSGQLADRNFLQAGWATGISSVGQTKRNANLQLRSEFPNPQVSVSPWLQTTISPDILRKPLEVGLSGNTMDG